MNSKQPLLWLAAIAIITTAVILIGWEDIFTALQNVTPGIMALLIALQLFTLTLLAGQWQYLLKKGNCHLSLGHVLAVNLAGNYIESITPSVKIGGEAAKIYLFKRYSNLDYELLTGILLALKYFSLLPFVILSALSVTLAVLRFNLPALSLYAPGFLFVFFGFVAFLYYKKDANRKSVNNYSEPGEKHSHTNDEKNPFIIFDFSRKLIQAIRTAAAFINRSSAKSRNLTTLIESSGLVAISTLIWLLYPVKVFLVTGMLDLELSFLAVTIITFTAYMVSMVPLLPGGLGSYEGSMVLMFSLLGIAPAEGLAVALISRLITFWIPLLWSVLGAFYLAFYKPPAGSSSSSERDKPQKSGIAALVRN